ncbi:extracellular solute-binding protein [Gracilibacillus salitolerans]|uniref:Extracellular solute-binding protein n=1 Tax=Gracilibacillus salitolerans TaxID=2663022 RepID=A0A5Q2TPL3_9BACI|nr:ABC transporter substrate-binding protein [Gracilibacillus salitolerans]QGH36062.1 extracellular solute-binding protein [Gracilibacillus salitolerans]
MSNSIFHKLMFSFCLVLVMVLAACSSDDEASESASGENTVEFWHSMTDTAGDAVEQVIEEFEKEYPDIDIKATYVANQGEGQNEKLLTAIAGGNPPDVAYFDRFEVATWAAEGSLESLTDLAEEAGISKDDYYDFAWDELIYEGDLYGIPTTTDSRLLFYNRDHFEEVGLDPENPPTTIDELEEAAEKLTIKDGNRFERIGFIPWFAQGSFYSWGWSFGGDFYDPETGEVTADDPKNVEALEWITEFGKKYGVEDIAGFTDSQGSGAMDPFVSGQISMKIDGNFGVASLEKFAPDLNYGVTPIPTPTGDNFKTWSGGWSVVIPKGANNQDGAWEFLKFFGSEEGQKIFSEGSRDFSVIDSVNESLGYTDDPIFSEFINILPESNSRPVMTAGSLYWNALADAVESSTRENGTPKENLEEVTQRVTEALEE